MVEVFQDQQLQELIRTPSRTTTTSILRRRVFLKAQAEFGIVRADQLPTFS